MSSSEIVTAVLVDHVFRGSALAAAAELCQRPTNGPARLDVDTRLPPG